MPHPTPPRPTTTGVPTLDHERLDVYQAALAFDRLATALLGRLPRGCAGSADQLSRASAGVALSIAESAGRRGADRAHHARIARGSAPGTREAGGEAGDPRKARVADLGAVLDLLAHRRALAPAARAEGRLLLGRVNAMLAAYERSARAP